LVFDIVSFDTPDLMPENNPRNIKFFQRLSSRAALLIAVVVAVGGVVAITLAVLAREGDDGPGLDPAVERLIPDEGAEVLVQRSVGIDLVDSPRFVIASFRINGVEIPEEEWQFSRGTNNLIYQFGDGQTLEQLQPERNCVVVEFYPQPEGVSSSRQVNWCFNAA